MINSITVYGAGCESCKKLLTEAEKAVKEMNLDIKVEYFDDVKSMFEKGIMHAPALLINEKIISTGTLLSSDDIKKHLQGQTL